MPAPAREATGTGGRAIARSAQRAPAGGGARAAGIHAPRRRGAVPILRLLAAACITAALAPRAQAADSGVTGGHPPEYYGGWHHLDMGDRGTGFDVYTGLRLRPRERSLIYAQTEYLDRFEKREGRLLVGGAFPLADSWNLSGEAAAAPGAEVFPRAAAWVELGRPVAPRLALSTRLTAALYRDARLLGASLGCECYPRGNCAVIARAAFSTVDFEGAPASTDGSGLVKIIYFLGERTRIFAYGAAGNESFRIETMDRTGDIRSNVIGIGCTVHPRRSVALTPSFEYQTRDRGPRYVQLGLEVSVAP